MVIIVERVRGERTHSSRRTAMRREVAEMLVPGICVILEYAMNVPCRDGAGKPAKPEPQLLSRGFSMPNIFRKPLALLCLPNRNYVYLPCTYACRVYRFTGLKFLFFVYEYCFFFFAPLSLVGHQ